MTYAGESARARDSGRAEQATGPKRERLVAAGGMIGAIAASGCCIVPLLLFSVGAGGAWIGNLTALAPFQPIFVGITLGFLGYGHWLVNRRPKAACADESACARPIPNRIVKLALWLASALVVAATAFPYAAPIFLDA